MHCHSLAYITMRSSHYVESSSFKPKPSFINTDIVKICAGVVKDFVMRGG